MIDKIQPYSRPIMPIQGMCEVCGEEGTFDQVQVKSIEVDEDNIICNKCLIC